jgi:predicted nucleic acid-binding protein
VTAGVPSTELVVDASVAVKWFHEQGEPSVAEARRLMAAHRDGEVILSVLDLTAYEVGNVMLVSLRRTAEQATATLTALRALCPAIVPSQSDLARAADLADEHGLTFYDAAYAAVARERGGTLVTADRALVRLPWCEDVATAAARLA